MQRTKIITIVENILVNTLRLLVNLSCTKDNVQHFLIEKIMVLARFMDPTMDEGIVLRTVVIQLNVLQNIANDPVLKEKAKDLAEGVEDKLDVLETCRNEEIATKAKKIKKLLNNL
ncbi:hypothetical protein AC249_AIPGENE23953 [Exaiptasia diaphana]|nr:hypothetical protein AC249_AIPGENE23953 [Exaiptasia diaphana]